MQARRTFLTAAAAGLLLAPDLTRGQFYLGGDLGGRFRRRAGPGGTRRRPGSRVRRVHQPAVHRRARLHGPVRRGDSWMSRFDGAVGVLAGAAAGYSLRERFPGRLLGRFRPEVEYFTGRSVHDRGADADIRFASGTAGPRAADRRARAGGRQAGRRRRPQRVRQPVFRLLRRRPLHAWVGFGGGVGFIGVDYGTLGLLNSDPARITSGADLPNAEQIRSSDSTAANRSPTRSSSTASSRSASACT